MADTEACCTCASLLNSAPTYTYSLETEKPIAAATSASSSPPRRLPCCSRAICAACLTSNPRFHTYCPFCQVSSEPSALPQGLRDPPAYSSPPGSPRRRALDAKDDPDEQPPPYTSREPAAQRTSSEEQQPAEDVVHHLHPDDNIPALSLAYHTPAAILRMHNSLFSESLLHARKLLLIPRSYYAGPSLSPDPVDSEEETERKAAIRRFMVGAKCHEYEMAELYLKQADGDVDRALERWRDDERWERENPFEKRGKGKANEVKRRVNGSGGGLVGQLR